MEIYEGDTRLRNRALSPTASRFLGQVVRRLMRGAWLTSPGPSCRATRCGLGPDDVRRAVRISDPSDRSRFSINPRLGRLGQHVVTALRFLPPGGPSAHSNLTGDRDWSGWSPVVSGCAAVCSSGVPPHPGRHGSSAVPVLPGDSVSTFGGADSGGDVFHGGAFHYVDRVGVQLAPDALWFPPLIETLIAASIVYMALEKLSAAQRSTAVG